MPGRQRHPIIPGRATFYALVPAIGYASSDIVYPIKVSRYRGYLRTLQRASSTPTRIVPASMRRFRAIHDIFWRGSELDRIPPV